MAKQPTLRDWEKEEEDELNQQDEEYWADQEAKQREQNNEK